MILFLILKLTKVIGLSWWWILLGPVIAILPMGLTIAFVLMKCFDVFLVDVSWWWILLAIVLDLGEIAGFAIRD